ncbi:D-beta-hydroxybutyrate dehydrogenase, mitochondrial-like [Ruditapes philippinarum]|uniref:D-beta-hydroxybutyrate dehydrogenase, mitochondrial-like n=1 Tax=Ruditapes philippinarum TaxID=129788 RepID=UPI00295C29BA|nr:D-beta-hydroxybutyrate dehydrogenase, mitochondrial-like [Ruditapes philippinarum]
MAGLDLIDLKLVEFTYFITFCVVIYSVVSASIYAYLISVFTLYVCLKVIRKKSTGTIEIKHQGVFITGCDTGFGHDLARRLDSLQFTVFAGCLHPEGDGAKKLKSASSKRLHVVPLDVGSDESVQEAHDYVVKHLPNSGMWAIVSNAGFNVMGDVELCTIDLYKKAMNVNYFGAIRTIRNFLYMVRKNKGRVVIVSSVKGRFPFPADSAYHVTKHGLETMGDSLRLEMLKFGVQVSIIEPGAYASATSCQNKHVFDRYREEADEMWKTATEDVRKTYGRKYVDAEIAKQENAITGSALTSKPVIDALEDAIVSERPHTRYLVGGGIWFDPHATMARYYDYLPTWLTDWIIIKWSGCDKFPDYKKLKLE